MMVPATLPFQATIPLPSPLWPLVFRAQGIFPWFLIYIFFMYETVKWSTSWLHFWADSPGFSDVYQGSGWLCLLSWPWEHYHMYVWEGREWGKWQMGKRGFQWSEYQHWCIDINWITPSLFWLVSSLLASVHWECPGKWFELSHY